MLKSALKSAPLRLSKSFIDDAREEEKIIVLTTGRLDSWKPASPRVDAMTSASVMSRATTMGQTLAGKALDIINAQ